MIGNSPTPIVEKHFRQCKGTICTRLFFITTRLLGNELHPDFSTCTHYAYSLVWGDGWLYNIFSVRMSCRPRLIRVGTPRSCTYLCTRLHGILCLMVFTVYGICTARGLYVLPRAEPQEVYTCSTRAVLSHAL